MSITGLISAPASILACLAGLIYLCGNKYELRRLKVLEEENARLKRIVAQQVLDIELLKEINEYTRECLATRVAPSIPASGVVEVLEWLFLTHRVPKYLRSDNGTEFVARAVCRRLGSSGCQKILRKQASRRDWTIKGKGRNSFYM